MTGEKYKRKISVAGKYSYYVTIPKRLIKKLGWRERQFVEVSLRGKGLSIKDFKQKK